MARRALRANVAVCAMLAATFSAASQASPCAGSVPELRAMAADPGFPLRWRETSMSDGKPLVVSISEREGALFLAFDKTGEGLWAEGGAAVCADTGGFEARISKSRMRVGPAAHWIVRQSLSHGATFALRRTAAGQLRIATPGWSGVFAPLAD